MAFLPYGSRTRSQVLFLCRVSISSCIVVIHIDTFVLSIASWKVDGFLVTYFECQDGGLLSRVDHRTSGVSDSNVTSEEVWFWVFTIWTTLVSFKMLLFSSICILSFINMTSLLMTNLWAVGSHKWYPFTPSAYPKNTHFLDFESSLLTYWVLCITYTRLPNICNRD